MKTVTVKGKVFSGKGDGARFIELPWVKKQILEKLGFVPYPGTLDIRLTENGSQLKRTLEKTHAIEILPAPGFYRGRCHRACMFDILECAIIVPEIPDYSEDALEIIAPISLKKKFGLKDGDVVDVKIMLK